MAKRNKAIVTCTTTVLQRSMTVGDCVLIKLQSHFSMESSDCARWLFIAAFECSVFFCAAFSVFFFDPELFTIWNNSRRQWFFPCDPIIIELMLSQGTMHSIHTESDFILDILWHTVNIPYYKWSYFHFPGLCKICRCLNKNRFFPFESFNKYSTSTMINWLKTGRAPHSHGM